MEAISLKLVVTVDDSATGGVAADAVVDVLDTVAVVTVTVVVAVVVTGPRVASGRVHAEATRIRTAAEKRMVR